MVLFVTSIDFGALLLARSKMHGSSGDPFMLPALYIGLWVHSTPILYFSFDSAYDIVCTAAISRSTALSFRVPLRNDPMGDPFVAVVILALYQPACASPFQTCIQAASA